MSVDMSIPVSYLTSDRSGTESTTGSNQMDKEAFLKLLIAQLRSQDPTSPTDSETILTQTTQLATMETMSEQIATARESFALQMRAAAAALVGQSISWLDAEGADQDGVVSGVSYDAAVPQLRVGDTDVALDAVLTVGSVPTPAPAD